MWLTSRDPVDIEDQSREPARIARHDRDRGDPVGIGLPDRGDPQPRRGAEVERQFVRVEAEPIDATAPERTIELDQLRRSSERADDPVGLVAGDGQRYSRLTSAAPPPKPVDIEVDMDDLIAGLADAD